MSGKIISNLVKWYHKKFHRTLYTVQSWVRLDAVTDERQIEHVCSCGKRYME